MRECMRAGPRERVHDALTRVWQARCRCYLSVMSAHLPSRREKPPLSSSPTSPFSPSFSPALCTPIRSFSPSLPPLRSPLARRLARVKVVCARVRIPQQRSSSELPREDRLCRWWLTRNEQWEHNWSYRQDFTPRISVFARGQIEVVADARWAISSNVDKVFFFTKRRFIAYCAWRMRNRIYIIRSYVFSSNFFLKINFIFFQTIYLTDRSRSEMSYPSSFF